MCIRHWLIQIATGWMVWWSRSCGGQFYSSVWQENWIYFNTLKQHCKQSRPRRRVMAGHLLEHLLLVPTYRRTYISHTSFLTICHLLVASAENVSDKLKLRFWQNEMKKSNLSSSPGFINWVTIYSAKDYDLHCLRESYGWSLTLKVEHFNYHVRAFPFLRLTIFCYIGKLL